MGEQHEQWWGTMLRRQTHYDSRRGGNLKTALQHTVCCPSQAGKLAGMSVSQAGGQGPQLRTHLPCFICHLLRSWCQFVQFEDGNAWRHVDAVLAHYLRALHEIPVGRRQRRRHTQEPTLKRACPASLLGSPTRCPSVVSGPASACSAGFTQRSSDRLTWYSWTLRNLSCCSCRALDPASAPRR